MNERKTALFEILGGVTALPRVYRRSFMNRLFLANSFVCRSVATQEDPYIIGEKTNPEHMKEILMVCRDTPWVDEDKRRTLLKALWHTLSSSNESPLLYPLRPLRPGNKNYGNLPVYWFPTLLSREDSDQIIDIARQIIAEAGGEVS